MGRVFERRAARLLGIANALLADSRLAIWCYEPQHMPAMIDLLIAKGVLSESDRPHCVHWSAIRRPGETTQEEIGKTLDADAMLEEAGIRTLTGQQWNAWLHGREALEALWREWVGDLSADDLERLDELETKSQRSRQHGGASASAVDHTGPTAEDGA
jgi:hypothetical protein